MFNFAQPSRGQPILPTPVASVSTISPVSTGSLDLSEILERLRRRIGLILACGALALVLALLVLPWLPAVYTAQVQILIDPADLRVVENGVTPSSPLADSGVSMVESQVRVIGSDSVLGRVVSRLRLQDDSEYAKPLPESGGVLETLKQLLGLAAPANLTRDPSLRAIEELRRNVAIRRPERTFVIEVLVKSQGSDKAALIANTIAEIYSAQEIAARTNVAARSSEALAARLSELRQALQAAENRLAKYREDNHLVATNGRLLVDQRLGELNQQLTAASIRTAEARARADQGRQLRLHDGTALPEMLQSTELRALRQQQADLARQNAENSMRLGPKHPLVAEQNAQIRELDRAIAREKTRIIDSTVKELDRAVAGEAAILRELEKLKRETTTNERALIGLRELERDVDVQRTIYEAFLKRARETGQQERLDTTNIRVISPATPPLGRSWPPSPKMLLPLALLLGLAAGAGLAILRPTRSDPPASPVLVPLSGAAPGRA